MRTDSTGPPPDVSPPTHVASWRDDAALGVAIAVLAIFGVGLLLLLTRWGIGLSPDSAIYIAGARSLLEGHGLAYPMGGGLWNPITSWPPFYSIVLAMTSALGVDALVAARWVNALLLGGNAALTAVLLRRMLGRPPVVPLIGMLLFLFSADSLAAHGWAWSDPLFVFLGFLGLLWLDVFVERRRRRDLIAAAVLVGLSAFTRYIGVAFLVTGAAALLLRAIRTRPRRGAVVDAIAFVGMACLPLAAWSLRNLTLATNLGGDIAISRGMSPKDWLAIYDITSLWFLPGRIPEPARMAMTVALVAAFFVLTGLALGPRGDAATGSVRLGRMLLAFVVCYIGILLAARLAVRAFNIRDARYYLPLYQGLLILWLYDLVWVHRKLTDALSALTAAGPRRAGAMALGGVWTVLLVGVASFHGVQAAKLARESYTEGLGYSGSSWRTSNLLAYVRRLPSDTPVISNAFDAIYVLTRRAAYPFPRSGRESAIPTGMTQAQEWQRTADVVRDRGALVAAFHEATRKGQVTIREIGLRISLCRIDSFPEGSIYGPCESR